MSESAGSSRLDGAGHPPAAGAADRLEELWRQGGTPDVFAFLATGGDLAGHEVLAVLQVDQQRRWRRGERVLVEAYLARLPAIRQDAAGLVELVASEVSLRDELGETPDFDSYAARFPGLLRSLEVHFALREARRKGDLGKLPGLSTVLAVTASLADADLQTLDPSDPASPGDSKVTIDSSLPPGDGKLRLAVGQHQVQSVLGRGGMGVVYKAYHLQLKRVVALKMISAGLGAGPEDSARFRGEAEAAAGLAHANIVQVYELGEHEGQPYFSLEYMDGGSLAERLTRDALSAQEAARLLETLARAMHFAHERGVVHRDLKPANVLLTSDGTPKIADFGLAKRLDQDSNQTKSGAILGTPSYMAPEQADGQASQVRPAADVYALGAILYHILTGRPPFRGETAWQTIEQVRTQEPLAPSRVQPRVPKDLETVCLKCLQKDPQRRYASALALAEDLRRFLDGEPILARPVGRAERAWKWTKRHPTMAALVAVSVLSVAALGTAGMAHYGQLRTYNRQLEATLDLVQRGLYASQLGRVQALAESDPAQGLELLLDGERCPEARREFAWRRLRHACRRDRLTFTEHLAEVRAVACAPDGRLAASADARGTIWLWEISTGRPVHKLAGHEGGVNALAFDRGSQLLVTAGEDGTLRLWDVASGEGRASVQAHVNGANAVAFAPDGQTLASGGADQRVLLWDVGAETPRRELLGHTGSVFAVAFSPDGNVLASAGRDSKVRLWDLASGEIKVSLEGHPRAVTSLAFTSDGTLASAGEEGTVYLWDMAQAKPRFTLTGHAGVVNSLAFAADGRMLASAGTDQTVRLWDTDTGRQRTVLRGHQHAVSGVAFAPDGSAVVSASADHTVRVWEAAMPAPVTLARHERLVTAVAFSPDGQSVLAGDYDGALKLWSVAAGEAQATLQETGAAVGTAAFARDGTWLAWGSADGNVYVRDVAKGKVRHTIAAHLLGVASLAISPDGGRLATVGNDGEGGVLKLWDPATGQEHPAPPGQPSDLRSVAFAPDRPLLTVGCGDGTLAMWDLDSGGPPTVRALGQGQAITCLAFSADGRTLATASGDRAIKLFDPVIGQELATLRSDALQIHAIAFSPDGTHLASGCGDGTVRLWLAP